MWEPSCRADRQTELEPWLLLGLNKNGASASDDERSKKAHKFTEQTMLSLLFA